MAISHDEFRKAMEQNLMGALGGARFQEEPKYQEPKQMWRAHVYQKDELILDHAQTDFGKVFRFVMSSLAELHNNGVQDYRVTIADAKGNLYFFAVGPQTVLTNYKKAEDMK